ncbi:PREDICTED: neuferricin [Dinoponera quadriceps]|uniref:Neuferricin n=1 Tax=Dinoponera quadriceps TaxID=609295 RepID=A0A6P3YBJ7_DINQU|nr:PREDICTED: neuferricin [Dinoponera quadriceps]
MFINNAMLSKYLWLSLLPGIVYFLYSLDFIKEINTHLADGTLNVVDIIYFGLNENSAGQKIFTTNELKRYTNLENGLYLSILGKVFDVTKGQKHYGPGGNYHAFTGRDASLAFITGEFDDNGLTDDVSSLSVRQVKALNDWVQFYNTNYIYKGKLYGRYYNQNGSPTAESHKVQEKVLLAEKENSLEEKQKRMFPPCNVEWNPDTGTIFWCTKRSGGLDRDWVGVPRMFFETANMQSSRCACVKLDSKEYEENKAMLREYIGCAKLATKCIVEIK